ncbi:hypothetical protein MPSEU_000047000 [Mayamaea pseudoterrestris]|nr:hypothetical protein MPSEU_000047000 [Mayamaea pseudoterrestris]
MQRFTRTLHYNRTTMMEEPLLKPTLSQASTAANSQERRNAQDAMKLHSSFCTVSLLLGVLIGFLVECIVLTAHAWTMQRKVSDEANDESDANVPTLSFMIATSFAWALTTSLVPCTVLILLKKLLRSFMRLMAPAGNNDGSNNSMCQFDSLIWQLECRFGIGSFCGVSLASLFVDWLMEYGHSPGFNRVLMAALLCIGLVLLWTAKTNQGNVSAAHQVLAPGSDSSKSTCYKVMTDECNDVEEC